MAERFKIDPRDIAAANLSFTLVQAVLDFLVERKVLTNQDLVPLLSDMEKWYSVPGRADRKPIRDEAAKALRAIAAKYDTPPPEKQH